MTKDEMENRISMAIKDPILQQGFEIICKELTDLQKEVIELRQDKNELEQENEEMKKGLGCETCQIHLEYMRLNDKIRELELELTVEKDQHQEEINLHLHAEDYIKSLEEENNKLLDVINNQDVKIADLVKQIEKMKCCANCEKYFVDCKMEDVTEEEYFRANAFCKHWKLKEIEK